MSLHKSLTHFKNLLKYEFLPVHNHYNNVLKNYIYKKYEWQNYIFQHVCSRVRQTYKVKNKSENIHPHSPQIDALGRAISKNVIFIKFEACSDSIPWLLKFYYKFYYNLS